MKIETKFDVGEDCYLMHKNKVAKCTIESMNIIVKPDRICIYCNLKELKSEPVVFLEEDLFKTKQELLESL